MWGAPRSAGRFLFGLRFVIAREAAAPITTDGGYWVPRNSRGMTTLRIVVHSSDCTGGKLGFFGRPPVRLGAAARQGGARPTGPPAGVGCGGAGAALRPRFAASGAPRGAPGTGGCD